MGYYSNDRLYQHSYSKPKGGNNVTQNINPPQGYYVGSASNMARIFILILFLIMLSFSGVCYYYGKELGRLEQKIDSTRITPCISGVKHENISKGA